MSTAYGNSQSDPRLDLIEGESQLTTVDLIASTFVYSANTVVRTTGYATQGDGGKGDWVPNGVTGQTVNQSPAQLVNTLLNDGLGNQWELVPTNGADSREVQIEALGGLGDGTTNCLLPFNAAAASFATVIRFGAGKYKTTGSLVVDVKFKKIIGTGRKSTKIVSTLSSGNIVEFSPAAPSGGSEFLADCGISDITITSSTTANTCIGLYLEQVSTFVLTNFSSDATQRGLVVAGGQLNQFSNFTLSASGNTASSIAGAGLLELIPTLKSDAVSYQNPFTCQFSNFSISGSFLAESLMLIAAADGVNFSNCYLGNGLDNTINFDVNLVGSNLTVVNFTNIYCDGINTSTGTLRAIKVSSDSSDNANFVSFNNFFIGNYQENGAVLSSDIGNWKFNTGTFSNIPNWGIDAALATSSSLIVNNTSFTGCGTVAAKGAIQVDTSRITKLSDIMVNGASGTGSAAFRIEGAHDLVNIADCSVQQCDIDLLNNISSGDFIQTNNSTLATTKNMGGMSIQNKDINDNDLLDYYQEWNTTPTITFGGAAVGVTYSTQQCRTSRIGRMVFFTLKITLTSKGSSVGSLLIDGLPVSSLNLIAAACSVRASSLLSTVTEAGIYAQQQQNATTIRLDKGVAGGSGMQQLADTDLTNTSSILVSGQYQAAS